MKINKIINTCFLSIFLIILFGGLIKPYVRSVTINDVENRTANQIPKLSPSAFVDKTFQDLYETAMADQIPLATQMKLAEKSVELLTKLSYFRLNEKSSQKINEALYYNEGYLIAIPEEFTSESKKGLDSKIKNLNHTANRLKNINFYLYYIEKDDDINYNTNVNANFFEYMKDNLSNRIHSKKFTVNTLNEYKEMYFQTDHHWNHKGAYKAYSDIIEWMNLGEPIKKGKEVCSAAIYSGSRDALIGGNWLFKEPFCVYSYEFKPHHIVLNRSEPTLNQNSKVLDDNDLGYGAYYGWDVGFIEYDFFQENKGNLLIIGNSFDNAINELLASHFNHTYNVDLRHYEDDLNESFDIYQFVKQHNIDNVLFVGNYSFYVNDTFNLKGGN